MDEKIKVSFDYNKTQFNGVKSPIVWKHNPNNSIEPIAYIRKPKGANEKEFNDLIEWMFNKMTFYV